jgi:hypothetical protein
VLVAEETVVRHDETVPRSATLGDPDRCAAPRLASRPRLTLRSTTVILADGTLRETSTITVVVVRVVVAIAP